MHVLFVCTGNTCRSPLAEGLARQRLAERGVSDVVVSSAGTAAWPDAPASDGSLLVALEHDIDLSGHRARLLSRELVEQADLVLTMGPHHLERVEALGGAGKAFLLTDYASRGAEQGHIGDPFGGGLETYRAMYAELERELQRALARLMADTGSQNT